MFKQDLALNNLLGVIDLKNQPNLHFMNNNE